MKKVIAYFRELLVTLKSIDASLKTIASAVSGSDHYRNKRPHIRTGGMYD